MRYIGIANNSDQGGAPVYSGLHYNVTGYEGSQFSMKDGTQWPSGDVFCLCYFDKALYVGGRFTSCSGVSANRIAKFANGAWSALGSGMDNMVSALFYDGQYLYAGGDFTTAGGSAANYVAKWDGANWSAIGSGPSASVRALYSDNTYLYAGGDFGIEVWDGATWTTPYCKLDGTVMTLKKHFGTFYVGGDFTATTVQDIPHLAQFDNSKKDLVAITEAFVDAPLNYIRVNNGIMYVVGDFTSSVKQFNGTAWSDPSFTITAEGMQDITFMGSDVYALVTPTGAYDVHCYFWDGASWTDLFEFNVVDYNVRIDNDGTLVYVAARVSGAESYFDVYDGANWYSLSGPGNKVFNIHHSGDYVYIGSNNVYGGGAITAVDHTSWNGSDFDTYTDLDGGVFNADASTANVYAICSYGSNVYVGGSFNRAGSAPITVSNVAMWNGSSWSALGSGLNGTVRDLFVNGTDLYARGSFSVTYAGKTGTNIAKWNGSYWAPIDDSVGTTTTNTNYGVAYYNGVLYLCGTYNTKTTAKTLKRICTWTGELNNFQSWAEVGAGINKPTAAIPIVYTTLEKDGILYVAGSYTSVGSPAVSTTGFASYFNGTWTSMWTSGGGMVYGLDQHGNNIYVGGTFQSANGITAYNITMWNGSEYVKIPFGVDVGGVATGYVNTVLCADGKVFAGGLFNEKKLP